MTRVRARRARDRRDEWAFEPAADLARGVDLDRFTSPLARILASQATRLAGHGDLAAAVARLTSARATEAARRALASSDRL